MVDSLTPANEPDSTPVYEHWGHGPGGTAPHSAVLTDEELAEMLSWRHHHLTPTEARLIAALRASRAELAALSWATREYDEDTGYCLCGCCRHGI